MGRFLAMGAVVFLFATGPVFAGDKYLVLQRCANGLVGISAWPPILGNGGSGAPLIAAIQGNVLALVENDQEVGLWSLSSGNRMHRIEARAEHVALHPNLPILATAKEELVTLWCQEKRNGAFLPHTVRAVGKVSWLGFTPLGAPVVGTEEGQVEVFHLSGTYTHRKTPIRTEIEIQGKRVAFHDEIDDSFSEVHFLSLRAFPLLSGPVKGVIRADTLGFWAAFSGNEVALWRWQGIGKEQDLLRFIPFSDKEPVTAAAFSGTGEVLALGSGRGSVVLWDTLKRAEFAQASFHDAPVSGIQLDESGEHTLIGQGGKTFFCETDYTGKQATLKMLFSAEQSKHVLNGPVFGARKGLH